MQGYSADGDAYPTKEGLYFIRSDVEAALAEKDREIDNLRSVLDDNLKLIEAQIEEIATLKEQLGENQDDDRRLRDTDREELIAEIDTVSELAVEEICAMKTERDFWRDRAAEKDQDIQLLGDSWNGLKEENAALKEQLGENQAELAIELRTERDRLKKALQDISGGGHMNHKLKDKLTIFFCRYLQAVEQPPVTAEEFSRQETEAIERYQNDPIFHAKVSHLTAHVLQIVEDANYIVGEEVFP